MPTGYLLWLVENCKLSTGVRSAVRAELLSRGVHPTRLPPEPEPRPVRCRHCAGDDVRLYWQEITGARRIRSDCRRCGRFAGFAAETPRNVAQADAAQPRAGLLDALTLAERLGVQLINRGGWLSPEPYQRATPELYRLLRQNAHLLRGMLPRCPAVRG